MTDEIDLLAALQEFLKVELKDVDLSVYGSDIVVRSTDDYVRIIQPNVHFKVWHRWEWKCFDAASPDSLKQIVNYVQSVLK